MTTKIKSGPKRQSDISMGALDTVDICDVFGLYICILNEIIDVNNTDCMGLHHDDGIRITKSAK